MESAIHPVSEPTRYNRQYTGRKMRKSQSGKFTAFLISEFLRDCCVIDFFLMVYLAAMSTPVSRQTTMR